MLKIDLSGKRAFVAGVSDDGGFGFAIAKHLAQAGASVCVGTWPPTYTIFTKLLQLGKIKDSLQSRRRRAQLRKIYRSKRVRHDGDVPPSPHNRR